MQLACATTDSQCNQLTNSHSIDAESYACCNSTDYCSSENDIAEELGPTPPMKYHDTSHHTWLGNIKVKITVKITSHNNNSIGRCRASVAFLEQSDTYQLNDHLPNPDILIRFNICRNCMSRAEAYPYLPVADSIPANWNIACV